MSGPVLFLIPARAGSKRIIGKNLRLLAGIPLVGWAARRATQARHALPGSGHRVICSTDDPAIAEVASRYGAETPFLRPPELATDLTPSLAVAVHALDWFATRDIHVATLVLVQPTSPLATAEDLLATIDSLRSPGAASAATVALARHPGRSFRMGRIHPATQLLEDQTTALPDEDTVGLNGAAYAITVEELRRSGRFVTPGRTLGVYMPWDRSVDVDEEEDLLLCDALLASRAPRSFTVAGRTIGPGSACFVIAEAGVNHNGDIALAHRLVNAAADCGADAVKFQTFNAERLASQDAPLAAYQRSTGSSGQRAMLERLSLSEAAHAELRQHAAARGLIFLSSPFDEASADLLEKLDVAAFKLGSGEITNHPLLAHIAAKGRPLLLSTGMSEMWEVAAAVDLIAATGASPLCLLHCVSEYPAATKEANIRALQTLQRAFGVPSGFSDHTSGSEAALAAVALGASVIERHLTLDRSLPGPDHRTSSEPAEMASMVRSLRTVASALGSGEKTPTPGERKVAAVARKSLHWRISADAGTVVGFQHVEALRPGTGIPPTAVERVIGRRLRTSVRGGTPVRQDQLEEA